VATTGDGAELRAVIRFLRFDCARAGQVVPALSDAALQQALRDVCRMSEDVLAGRRGLAEGAEEQLLGIAMAMCREADKRWR
jgi:hypothetical protein